MLPNKTRGVRRVNDGRVLKGIFGCCGRGRGVASSPNDLRAPAYLLSRIKLMLLVQSCLQK
jgi:hypothetical protein